MNGLAIFLFWVIGYIATGTYVLTHTPYPVRLDDFIGAVFMAVFWPFTITFWGARATYYAIKRKYESAHN